MTSATISITGEIKKLVLVDYLMRSRSWLGDTAVVLVSVALVAVAAQISIPMWPIPITGQTLAVLLVGATLGARRATAALTAYMLVGLAGVPVFAEFTAGPATIFKPSFGYIIGFIFAAYTIGKLSEHNWDRQRLLALAGFGLASVIPFLTGVPYLAFVLSAAGKPMNLSLALQYGVTPFLLGGVIKWWIAAALLPTLWAGIRKLGLLERD